MTARRYIVALFVAGFLSALGLAFTAHGHFALGIALPSIAILVALPPLLWLLRKAQR